MVSGFRFHRDQSFRVAGSLAMFAGLIFCNAVGVDAAPADEKTDEKIEQSEQSVDAQKSAAFAKATAAVRTAMMKRDLVTAKRQLKMAAANVQTNDDRAQAARLQILLSY